ncbi:hypothetical protein DITRI_Ditri08aG0097300 [Diplodiscus trichospermus]
MILNNFHFYFVIYCSLEIESTNYTNEVIAEIQSTIASSSRSYSRRFSKVWEDFDIVQEGRSPTKKTKAICKHYEKGYSAASRLGTSHLQRHLEGCSKRPKEAHTQVDQHAYRELVASAIIEHGYHLHGLSIEGIEIFMLFLTKA